MLHLFGIRAFRIQAVGVGTGSTSIRTEMGRAIVSALGFWGLNHLAVQSSAREVRGRITPDKSAVSQLPRTELYRLHPEMG